MDILLGSETWEIIVTCMVCQATEVMYVPTDRKVEDIKAFLTDREWSESSGFWTCPKHEEAS